jgi:cytidylate kinase
VAERLDFAYLDTGAMYRASALTAIRNGIPLDEPERVASCIRSHLISLDRTGRVTVDGEDVSGLIRTPSISDAASVISAGSAVRREMVLIQRRFGTESDTVAEGRDMGTVVFPDAFLKIYVIADIAVRVMRRWRELRNQGLNADFSALLAGQLLRDNRDRTRADSPLRYSPGAALIDSSLMSVAEQAEAVVSLYLARKGRA